MLKFFQGFAFGFGHDPMGETKLQNHAARKEDKNRPTFRKGLLNHWAKEGDHRSKNPMRAGTPRLSRAADRVRENFGNEHPDNRPLAHRVGRNEHEDKRKREHGGRLAVEGKCDHAQGEDVAQGANVHQLLATQSIDEVEAHKREQEVDSAQRHARKQGFTARKTRIFEDGRGVVQDEVDARKLVEHRK